MTLKAKLLTCFVSVFFLMALVGLHSFYELNHAQESARQSSQSSHSLQAAFSDAYRFVSSPAIRLDDKSASSAITQLRKLEVLSPEASTALDSLISKLENSKGIAILSDQEQASFFKSLGQIMYLEEKAQSEAITRKFIQNTKRRNSWARTAVISFLVSAFVTLIMCGSIVIEVDSLAVLAKKVVTAGTSTRVRLASGRTKNANDEIGFVANVLEDIIDERRSLIESSPNPQALFGSSKA